MSTSITLPAPLTDWLELRAQRLQLSVDQLVAQLISDALLDEQYDLPPVEPDENFPTQEEIVAGIQALPPNPKTFHPATKSVEQLLADLAASPSPKSGITPSEWDRMWAAFEQENKTVDLANETAEGRV